MLKRLFAPKETPVPKYVPPKETPKEFTCSFKHKSELNYSQETIYDSLDVTLLKNNTPVYEAKDHIFRLSYTYENRKNATLDEYSDHFLISKSSEDPYNIIVKYKEDICNDVYNEYLRTQNTSIKQ